MIREVLTESFVCVDDEGNEYVVHRYDRQGQVKLVGGARHVKGRPRYETDDGKLVRATREEGVFILFDGKTEILLTRE